MNDEPEVKDEHTPAEERSEEGVTVQEGRTEETPGEQRSEGPADGNALADDVAEEARDNAAPVQTETTDTHVEETHTEVETPVEEAAPAPTGNGGIE